MDKSASLARPSLAQYRWQQLELGLFIHWFPMGWYQDIDLARVREPAYQQELLARCTCRTLNTDQWVQSALDLGAKYLVFVAKHALGFCAWQTAWGSFGMKNIPYQEGRGDVVRDLAASCRKAGIHLGIYLAADSLVLGAGAQGLTQDPADQPAYNQIYRGWLTELLSQYGDMVEVWFDGSLAIPVGDILAQYAREAMVFQSPWATIRWVGQEEGYASDPAWNSLPREAALSGVATQRQGDPDGQAWLPLECDARLRRDWGWHDKLEENPLKSLDQLLAMYYGSVGRGATLLLNQAPHPQGHIIPEDMARMKELGDAIKSRFAQPLASARGVSLELNGFQLVDHVLLQEDIRQGHRVRAYRVEGLTPSGWRSLCAGTAIGHKKIDYFEAVSVSALRVKMLEAVGAPLIERFAAFFVGSLPKALPLPREGQVQAGEWGTEHYDWQTARAHLDFNLTPFIHHAGQYRASFQVFAGQADRLHLEGLQLLVDGIAQPDYVSPGEEAHSYILFVPAIGSQLTLEVQAYDASCPAIRVRLLLERLL